MITQNIRRQSDTAWNNHTLKCSKHHVKLICVGSYHGEPKASYMYHKAQTDRLWIFYFACDLTQPVEIPSKSLISPLKNLVWNQGAMYMYGEFHVRSRVKWTYYVGFATLVLEFFLEFAPRSLSHTHTRIFKKNLKDQVRLRRFLQCFHVSTKLYVHCAPYQIEVGQASKNHWVTKWLNPPRWRQ